jgi:superfamily I DNA and/or RNA helicase
MFSPWYSENLKKLNSQLFIDAIKVNEAFVIKLNKGTSKKVSSSIKAFLSVLQNKNKNVINNEELQNLWDIFFLVFPIVSTSFASFQTMFKGLEKNSLPWLFIDEAGQALPYSALGALYRSKRAVIVGDPFQIEPVCTLPDIFIDSIIKHYQLDPEVLNPKLPSLISVQVIADRQNKYGTTINGSWVGSPLRVHRRCMNPMFDIANKIAYDDLMIFASIKEEKKASYISSIKFESAFIDVKGNVKGKHFVENQAIKIVEIIQNEILHNKNELPDLYIISPFSEIVYQLGKFIEKELKFDQTKLKVWIKSNIGTVHTFQGKEADGVILCLGLDKSKKSAAIWASGKPNLINVALTRAKQKFIAIGDADLWLKDDIFPELKSLG